MGGGGKGVGTSRRSGAGVGLWGVEGGVRGVGMARRMGAGVWLWGVEGGKSVGRSRRRGAGVGGGDMDRPDFKDKEFMGL